MAEVSAVEAHRSAIVHGQEIASFEFDRAGGTCPGLLAAMTSSSDERASVIMSSSCIVDLTAKCTVGSSRAGVLPRLGIRFGAQPQWTERVRASGR